MALLPSGASPLDGPPPAPGSAAAPMHMRGAAQPILPAGALPPDVLMSVMQSGAQFVKIIDLWAQSLPALTADFDQLKAMVDAVLTKVAQVGGGGAAPATSEVATGANFPGASTPLGPSGAAPMSVTPGQ
jgi:hypothetical protein